MKFKSQTERTKWGFITFFHNRLAKFAVYTYADDNETAYLANFLVSQMHKGHGTETLKWIFDYAKKMNYKALILNVRKDSWVQRWYERNGFAYMEDCKGDYIGNVWMRKDLFN